MSRFKAIDDKLKQFGDRHKAEIRLTGPKFWIGDKLVPPDKVETRRIQWNDGTIFKAIFIIPNFSSGNIDYPSWNFELEAWIEDKKSYPKGPPYWAKNLLKGVAFTKIYKNIDRLLAKSTEYLDALKPEDLIPQSEWKKHRKT